MGTRWQRFSTFLLSLGRRQVQSSQLSFWGEGGLEEIWSLGGTLRSYQNIVSRPYTPWRAAYTVCWTATEKQTEEILIRLSVPTLRPPRRKLSVATSRYNAPPPLALRFQTNASPWKAGCRVPAWCDWQKNQRCAGYPSALCEVVLYGSPLLRRFPVAQGEFLEESELTAGRGWWWIT